MVPTCVAQHTQAIMQARQVVTSSAVYRPCDDIYSRIHRDWQAQEEVNRTSCAVHADIPPRYVAKLHVVWNLLEEPGSTAQRLLRALLQSVVGGFVQWGEASVA